MLDHIGLNVSNYERSRDFYPGALAPLRLSLLMEPVPRTGGFGRDGKPWFWITDQRKPTSENVHVAFLAPDGATVDAFHAAALGAGGTDNGAPGIRELYHATFTARTSSIPIATTSRWSATIQGSSGTAGGFRSRSRPHRALVSSRGARPAPCDAFDEHDSTCGWRLRHSSQPSSSATAGAQAPPIWAGAGAGSRRARRCLKPIAATTAVPAAITALTSAAAWNPCVKASRAASST